MQFRGNWMLIGCRIDRDCSQTNNLRKQTKVTLIWSKRHFLLEDRESSFAVALVPAERTIALDNLVFLSYRTKS